MYRHMHISICNRCSCVCVCVFVCICHCVMGVVIPLSVEKVKTIQWVVLVAAAACAFIDQ